MFETQVLSQLYRRTVHLVWVCVGGVCVGVYEWGCFLEVKSLPWNANIRDLIVSR